MCVEATPIPVGVLHGMPTTGRRNRGEIELLCAQREEAVVIRLYQLISARPGCVDTRPVLGSDQFANSRHAVPLDRRRVATDHIEHLSVEHEESEYGARELPLEYELPAERSGRDEGTSQVGGLGDPTRHPLAA